MQHHRSDQELVQAVDAAHARVCAAQSDLFCLIVEVDHRQAWRGDGARDLAHWLAMRYGISEWKARRWIDAAHALASLPLLRAAFSRGALGIDKVVEVSRFATPDTEAKLISWAQGVSCGAIRHRGDLLVRRSLQQAAEVDQARTLSWWYLDEGRRFGLYAELPAERGAVVARALDRLAGEVPVLPGEEGPVGMEARRADALVVMASARLGTDADPDRATVIVHARLQDLAS